MRRRSWAVLVGTVVVGSTLAVGGGSSPAGAGLGPGVSLIAQFEEGDTSGGFVVGGPIHPEVFVDARGASGAGGGDVPGGRGGRVLGPVEVADGDSFGLAVGERGFESVGAGGAVGGDVGDGGDGGDGAATGDGGGGGGGATTVWLNGNTPADRILVAGGGGGAGGGATEGTGGGGGAGDGAGAPGDCSPNASADGGGATTTTPGAGGFGAGAAGAGGGAGTGGAGGTGGNALALGNGGGGGGGGLRGGGGGGGATPGTNPAGCGGGGSGFAAAGTLGQQGVAEHPQLRLYGCQDPCQATFPDVPVDHPFFWEVEIGALGGVLGGFVDGSYRPAAGVSRQAMAAFLYRLQGPEDFPEPAEPSFGDVPTDHPFFEEIEWLAATGITTGYADGGFHPAATITRQAMAAFLYRGAGQPDFTAPGVATFPDVPIGAAFFAEIEWLVSVPITTGYADGGFHPADTITRQAMAAFLLRYEPLKVQVF